MFTFKLRRGTTAQWLAANPILRPGEPGVELDTGKLKIGDGINTWIDLPYFLNQDQIQMIIDELNAEGVPGPAGKSAYQLAVEAGYVGDLNAWLLSLKGAKGDPGTPGTNGTNGLSAYQVAVQAGFSGNEAAWLLSLKGAKGDPGTPGTNGTDGVDGLDGLDAYQVALENGFVGSQAAWLASLKGEKGDTGDTGADGPQGPPGADGADYAGPNISVSSTEPLLPIIGDVWIDTSA